MQSAKNFKGNGIKTADHPGSGCSVHRHSTNDDKAGNSALLKKNPPGLKAGGSISQVGKLLDHLGGAFVIIGLADKSGQGATIFGFALESITGAGAFAINFLSGNFSTDFGFGFHIVEIPLHLPIS